MPEWTEVKPEELETGDQIRAYRGEFNRYESVVEADEEGDFYAPGIGYFANSWVGEGSWNTLWDKIERKSVLPTKPGYYLTTEDARVLHLDEKGRWFMNQAIVTWHASYLIERFAPFKRVYFKEDLEAAVRNAREDIKLVDQGF